MIAVIDYGMGNLRSVEKALQHLGHDACVTSSPSRIEEAERVILPGVGAFGAAMENLRRANGHGSLADAAVRAATGGRPFLGICLGMQLLLDRSDELGEHRGLGVIPGSVTGFEPGRDPSVRVPHMGWNELSFPREHPLFAGLEPGARVYFVHSFYCLPEEASLSIAGCRHGIPFCAAFGRGSIAATQFHPEKSGAIGLRILDNFARWRPEL